MIDERTIDRILESVDIVDVVRRYVPELKQKGSNYQCCCPFHNERTPSFIVNKARNTWHCFGACNEGGNAIKFVMKYNNATFPEARGVPRKAHRGAGEEKQEARGHVHRLRAAAALFRGAA